MDLAAQTLLDNPAWTALTTHQAHLGLGDALARRFDPEVSPFAAVASPTPAAYEALHRIIGPGEQVAVQSIEPLGATDSLRAQRVGVIHQMIDQASAISAADVNGVIRLGVDDAADMLDLTQRTKPGPFARRTHEMGNYIGIRDHGRLIAMAGERMHVGSYVEISAVCVDDAWRGKGLAARLMNILRAEIVSRGETPFLHVLSDNAGAFALYQRLGFVLRRSFHLNRLSHVDADSVATSA